MDQKLKDMSEALIKGQAPLVKELVQICLSNGVAPQEILSEGLIAGMNVANGLRKMRSSCPRL